MLLASHCDGNDIGSVGAQLLDRENERQPPTFRILFAHRGSGRRVSSGPGGNHRAGLEIAGLDLGRLRRRVDADY